MKQFVMYSNSKISKSASTTSLRDNQLSEAAGDAYFRPKFLKGHRHSLVWIEPAPPALHDVSPSSCASPSYERLPEQSQKNSRLSLFSAASSEPCQTGDHHQAQARSRSAVDPPRSKSETSETPSLTAEPPQSLTRHRALTAGRKTHCFFESIFLKSLPVIPAREVIDSFTLETCSSLPIQMPTDKTIGKVVKKPWCFVFCRSNPAQPLGPAKACLQMSHSLECPENRSIGCQTDAVETSQFIRRCPRLPASLSTEEQLACYALEAVDDMTFDSVFVHQSQCRWQKQCVEEKSSTIMKNSIGILLENVFYYRDFAILEENWYRAELCKPQCHPVKAHCVKELAATCYSSPVRYGHNQQASYVTEDYLNNFSGRTEDYNTYSELPRQQSQVWNLLRGTIREKECFFSECIFVKVDWQTARLYKLQNDPVTANCTREHAELRSPAESPSASVCGSCSTDTESTVLEADIARSGFDQLLQTLERARLRYNKNAVSCRPSIHAKEASSNQNHQQQCDICRIQTCPDTSKFDSSDIEDEGSEEMELVEDDEKDGDFNELELENRLHGNQSNIGEYCRGKSFICRSSYSDKTRRKKLFDRDLFYLDEISVKWVQARPYKRSHRPVKAHYTREPTVASSNWQISPSCLNCTEADNAPLAESFCQASRYSSGASASDQRIQMEPRGPSVKSSHSSGRYPSRRMVDREYCQPISPSNSQASLEQKEYERKQRRKRKRPIESPSLSVRSARSARTQSTVRDAAITRGGFDHLLQTLERARLRYNANAASTEPSICSTGGKQRPHGGAYQFEMWPASCSSDNPDDAEDESGEDINCEEENFPELPEGSRLDGNQSNAGARCSEKIYTSESGDFNNFKGDTLSDHQHIYLDDAIENWQRDKRNTRQLPKKRINHVGSPQSASAIYSSLSNEADMMFRPASNGKRPIAFGQQMPKQDRERLRCCASDVSTVPSVIYYSSANRRHQQQQQRQTPVRYQTCPADSHFDSREADDEQDENEKLSAGDDEEEEEMEEENEIKEEQEGNTTEDDEEEEDVEESEPENDLDSRTQSSVEDSRSNQSSTCSSPSCQLGDSCKPRQANCDGSMKISAAPPLIATGLSTPNAERREAELVDFWSQSLLTLTTGMETCMYKIRSTVAELQRSCDSKPM